MFSQFYFEPLKITHHTLIFPGTTTMKHLSFLSLGLCFDVSEAKKTKQLREVFCVIK